MSAIRATSPLHAAPQAARPKTPVRTEGTLPAAYGVVAAAPKTATRGSYVDIVV